MSGRVPPLYGSWLEQEPITVTFRWIKQHVATSPFLRTGVACCLPTCAQGSSVSVTELVGKGAAWGLLGVLALLIYPLVCVEPELRRRAYRWTRSSGGVRRGHCLRGSLGVHQITGKCATIHDGIICSAGYCWKLLYMLVLVRLPSFHDNYAKMVNWNKGHSGEIAGGHTVRPPFPLFGVFSFIETLCIGSGCYLVVSLGWSG